MFLQVVEHVPGIGLGGIRQFLAVMIIDFGATQCDPADGPLELGAMHLVGRVATPSVFH